jgi:hypothetical protein
MDLDRHQMEIQIQIRIGKKTIPTDPNAGKKSSYTGIYSDDHTIHYQ